MSGQFKVGEVLVGQKFIYATSKNGMECVIVEGLKMVETVNRHTGEITNSMKYYVQWSDGDMVYCFPENLRRKQPPAGEQSIMDMFKLPAPSKAKETA